MKLSENDVFRRAIYKMLEKYSVDYNVNDEIFELIKKYENN